MAETNPDEFLKDRPSPVVIDGMVRSYVVGMDTDELFVITSRSFD